MDDKMNDVIDEVQKRLGEEYEVKRVEVMKTLERVSKNYYYIIRGSMK